MTSWPDLVTTALLGTDRRDLPADLPEDLASFAARLGSDDGAGRLLDLAAGYTAYVRAGAVADSCAAPAQAPPASHEPAPSSAHQVLRRLVETRSATLVTEWLQVCVEHGRSVAPSLWTELADLATSGSGVDARLLRLAVGRRGLWFLSHNDRWLRLVTSDDSTVPVPGADTKDVVEPAERGVVGSVLAVRAQDRDQARSDLEAAWGRARAHEKLAVLRALTPDLAADDEPTLLRALRDRSPEVREAAATMICRLPDSGFGRRMAERAAGAVSLTRSLGRWRLAVTPRELDDSMAQDGVSDKPPRSFAGGPAAFVLRQILGATDLAVWTSGTRPGPAELLEVAARTVPEWVADLRAGWLLAAVRQEDSEWAVALLSAGEVDGRLVSLLSTQDRVAVATTWAKGGADPARFAELLMSCPRPWPDELARIGLELFSSGRLPATARLVEELGQALGLDGYVVLEDHVLSWVPPKGMSQPEAAQIRRGHARIEELLATRIAIREGFAERPATIRRFAVPHLR